MPDEVPVLQPLTERQQMILDFIKGSIRSRGFAPSLREICSHMNIKSTNGANDHLIALERKGYLRRESMKSRALQPTEFIAPKDDVAAPPTSLLRLSREELAQRRRVLVQKRARLLVEIEELDCLLAEVPDAR